MQNVPSQRARHETLVATELPLRLRLEVQLVQILRLALVGSLEISLQLEKVVVLLVLDVHSLAVEVELLPWGLSHSLVGVRWSPSQVLPVLQLPLPSRERIPRSLPRWLP